MKRIKRALIAFIIMLLCSAPMAASAWALELRGIMLGLASDIEAIARAMSLEDYATVKTRALAIAEHESPPVEERMMIMKFLAADAAGFKAADGVVHDGAERLAKAADAKDFFEAANGFMDVLAGCADCHAKYRVRIIEKFYGEAAKGPEEAP